MKLISTSALVLLGTTSAFAQPMSAPAPVVGEAQGVLPGVFSTATGGSLDVRGDYTYSDQATNDATLLNFTLTGQYITPQGFGGYLRIPYGYASDFLGDSSESGVGNLEIGGLFVAHNSPTLDLYGRVGLALDTAGNAEAFIVPISMLIPQGENALVSGFNSQWARFSGGMRTRGDVFVGAQLGFDYPLDIDGDAFDGILAATGAIGFAQPGFDITAGLTYLQVVGENSSDDDTFLNLNGGIDFDVSPKAKAFVHMGINLDGINDDTVLSFGGGIRVGI